eukprot:TRINITY_DN16240_c0_g1_i2.p1 TRINITY_DN16240_c0_g1~~TRINITY_DN16240_c0_g1_i2.p1  ORF type:complete len:124 (-),score=33.43 TRINITY_DN16240_c0_g1_i2:256-627(-)
MCIRDRSSDQGQICGSTDDCDYASGSWGWMLLLTVVCAIIVLGLCTCVLVCFDVPVPCCNKQVKRLMQAWSNRVALRARTENTPTTSAQPARQNVWNKLDDGEPVDSKMELEEGVVDQKTALL